MDSLIVAYCLLQLIRRYSKSQLMLIPYCRCCFRHNGCKEVCIPDMRDLGLVLTHDQIRNIIKYHELGWLTVLPATVALMMRVAVYFCDIWVLESFSKEYKLPVDSLRSIDAYQPQKWLIRDTFCQR